MSVNPVFPVGFNGGQMTDLPEFTGTFDGTELIEVVAPGNVAEGVNYSITSTLLAFFLSIFNFANTIVKIGATVGSPYEVLPTDTRVLLDKTAPSASYVDLGGAASRSLPVMVRDILGDADVNNITITFTGTADGNASPLLITNPYGGWVFNPLPSGNWFLTTP